MAVRLPIERIKLHFQPPDNLIEDTIWEYAEKFPRRERVPPVLVYRDGRDYYLADGFHRLAAASRVGRRTILAEVRIGTLAQIEAEWEHALVEMKAMLRFKSLVLPYRHLRRRFTPTLPRSPARPRPIPAGQCPQVRVS
jgi:hypothetical protein